MKRLTKFLSFLLVLSMILCMVPTAFAADFTDEEEIANKEAVSVLEAIDVIDGFSDGSFRATKTVTRGQATAFICRMLLGREAADKLVAIEAPFSDVSADNVFAGYIAYCATNGIVDGYSDGTFRPGATVTTIQFGKMVLTALGYNSNYEGFTESGWKTKVYNKLTENALLTEVTCGVNAGLTRQEAAQICFNALNLKTRTFIEDNTSTVITVGDAKVQIGGSTGHYVESSNTLATVYGLVKKQSACLSKFTNVKYEWVYGDKVIYTDAYEPVYTSVDTYKTTGQVYAELGLTTQPAVKAYLDGVMSDYQDPANYIKKDGTSKAIYFGPGVATSIYNMDGTYVVSSYVNVAVQADTDYNATSKGAIVNGELVSVPSTTKAGDWFIVTFNCEQIATCEPAVLVTGEYQGYVKGSSITVGGVKYTYAYEVAGIDYTVTDFDFKDKVVLVTDGTYAYCVYAYEAPVEEEKAAEYLMITTTGSAITKKDVYSEPTTTYYAKGFLADGSSFVDYVIADGEVETYVWYAYNEVKGVYYFTTSEAISTTMSAIGNTISLENGTKTSRSTKYIVNDGKKIVVYTGYNMVPEYTGEIKAEILATNGVATNVYVDVTEATLVKESEKEVVSTDTYYIASDYAVASGQTEDIYWLTVTAYSLDGKTKTTLTFERDAYNTLASDKLITNLVYDKFGYIKSFAFAETVSSNVKSYVLDSCSTVMADLDSFIQVIDKNTIVITDDTFTGYAYEVADDCVINLYCANGATKASSMTTLAKDMATIGYSGSGLMTVRIVLKSNQITNITVYGYKL